MSEGESNVTTAQVPTVYGSPDYYFVHNPFQCEWAEKFGVHLMYIIMIRITMWEGQKVAETF